MSIILSSVLSIALTGNGRKVSYTTLLKLCNIVAIDKPVGLGSKKIATIEDRYPLNNP
ncbi:6040_t:CDS:2 [Diversispora eburnea]|uniref:6040_t:CDS:1 n=1 Tax=Diversispora eburnea TaxID=1213867 RepID=A0A9N9B740_9GLOM|nr:6040_t:CDS:2 [Diversispora eburnea]